MSSILESEKPLCMETQLILALLDLKTERLLNECEALIISNVNREAQLAALESRVTHE